MELPQLIPTLVAVILGIFILVLGPVSCTMQSNKENTKRIEAVCKNTVEMNSSTACVMALHLYRHGDGS